MFKTWIQGELGMRQAPELVEGVGNGYRPDEQFVLLLDHQAEMRRRAEAQMLYHEDQLLELRKELERKEKVIVSQATEIQELKDSGCRKSCAVCKGTGCLKCDPVEGLRWA